MKASLDRLFVRLNTVALSLTLPPLSLTFDLSTISTKSVAQPLKTIFSADKPISSVLYELCVQLGGCPRLALPQNSEISVVFHGWI